MGSYWRLANRKQPAGMLDRTNRFVGNNNNGGGGGGGIRCMTVGIPTAIDPKRAAANVGQLASAGCIRSLEFWWDGRRGEKLDVVLATAGGDMDAYTSDFQAAWPNAAFEPAGSAVPDWFAPADAAAGAYQIWDAGYRHGHLSAVFDTRTEQDVITRMCGAMQQAACAWVQIVFVQRSFVPELQQLTAALRAHNKLVGSSDHYSASDLMSVSEQGGRDHPEKGRDFATHYPTLASHTDQKAQGEHVMVSVRGLLRADRDIRLDLSGVCSVPMQTRSFEYLVRNEYNHVKFLEGEIRIAGWPGGGRDGRRNEKAAGAAGGSGSSIGAWWQEDENNKDDRRPPKKKWWHREGGRRARQKEWKGGRLDMFAQRLLPDPAEFGRVAARYVARSFWGAGGYRARPSPPMILMTLPELGLLVRLPDTTTPNLTITRRQQIPQQQLEKTGFCLGFATRDRATAFDSTGFFGRQTEASAGQGVVLSGADIQTHIYVVGATKSGKTTMIRCIAKHMEMANLQGAYPNAFILVDPKGSDSYDFLRQCDPRSYELGHVTFLDPIDTRFSINVLELPPYDRADRQVVVSQYVGYIMQMIEYWYGGSDTFVRLKRILDTLLQYIYLNNDKPTFLDMYEIIVAMQKDGREMLVRMFKELGRPESALQQAVESVAGMEKQAYEPVLNRLEKFATDPVLRHMFCVRKSTVDFGRMVEAGSYTVIRLSPLNIPQHIITLAKQTLIVKLWFAIQERAERVKLEEDRTQVLLALDEFQDVAGLPVIEAMLTQARSYGLGLLLAHQTTTQLGDALFEIITGNAGTQFVGRVSGRDGGRFGDLWDPSYARELKSQLATQEYHHWTVRLVADAGQTQPLPIQFWPVLPPTGSTVDLAGFIKSQRDKFGGGTVGESMMSKAASRASLWLTSVPYAPPSRDEWEILCILAEEGEPMKLQRIVEKFRGGTTARDTVSGVLQKMHEKELLARPQKGSRSHALPYRTRQKYLEFDPAEIGTAEDIPRAMAAATSYYLRNRWFLCVAPQTVRKGRYRTDLVAYDYEHEEAVSVEVESAAETAGHPEHVRLNMQKWQEMGFARCHVWSTHPGIVEEREKLPDELQKNVQTFVVP